MTGALPSYVVDGPPDAPVVVLLGSLGSTVAMWEPQVAALGEHFRVVRQELRGHGTSPSAHAPFALQDMADDVVALLDELDVRAAHLVGLSLGGLVAQQVAVQAPQRVERLALCCTGAWLGPEQAWHDRAATVRASGTAALAPVVAARWLTPPFAAAHPELAADLVAMIGATDDESYARCCEAIAAADLRGADAGIFAPTLVISADQDPSIPADKGEEIAEIVAGAQFALVEDAAHLANLEQPTVVTALLLSHLAPTTR